MMDALRLLEEQRQITAWHDPKVLPGQPWDGVIREELDRSDLVLKDKPGDCLSAQLRIRCGQTG
jgi:hypothetical protein